MVASKGKGELVPRNVAAKAGLVTANQTFVNTPAPHRYGKPQASKTLRQWERGRAAAVAGDG